MYELLNLHPREYQKSIVATCMSKSCLVVLPTGTGKTAIFLLLAISRLNKFPDSKILLCSPTKPLCNQHLTTILEHINIEKDKVALLTGATNPEERKAIWDSSKIVVATPQTVESDLERGSISLENYSLVCIDEAHRSRMKYANTIIASSYTSQAKNPLILGLTASPGGTKDKITEICKNLNIEAVEIRSEEDLDLKDYVQKKDIEYVKVDLPKELLDVKAVLRQLYLDKITELRKYGLTKPASIVSRKDLLSMQAILRKEIDSGNATAFWGISLVAQAMKVDHSIELLETQGINQLKKYLSSLSKEQTKAAKAILKDNNFLKATGLIENLSDLEHPKLNELKNLIQQELSSDKESRIIIFANYRDTVEELIYFVSKIKDASPIRLVGQKLGMTQKQQIEAISRFESGINNVLITTSIGEEGLSIKEANLAIFYDSVSSEIRSIQRSGRVARVKPGKIVFLITTNSRDEAYYWTAKRKEKIMKKTLYTMKQKNEIQSKLNNDKDNNRP